MKILIIGNLGSGKTTMGQKIQEFTGYEFIQLSKLRKRYYDKNISGDYFSHYQFLKRIETNHDLILEFSGTGCHKYAIKRVLELSNDDVIVILCKINDVSILADRIDIEQYFYLSIYKNDILQHIRFMNNELNSDLANNFWKSDNFEVLEINMEDMLDFYSNVLKIRDFIFKSPKYKQYFYDKE